MEKWVSHFSNRVLKENLPSENKITFNHIRIGERERERVREKASVKSGETTQLTRSNQGSGLMCARAICPLCKSDNNIVDCAVLHFLLETLFVNRGTTERWSEVEKVAAVKRLRRRNESGVKHRAEISSFAPFF